MGVMPRSWNRYTRTHGSREPFSGSKSRSQSEKAREFCRPPAAACSDHRFGAALQSDGNLIALGSVRRHTELPGVASIGYSVLPAFWSQGFGTELAALLVEFAAGTLGAHEVCAATLEESPASARILENLASRSGRWNIQSRLAR
jgi:RimJ/RimL family protein N-acetyltransferase